jgi:hypothetical protein
MYDGSKPLYFGGIQACFGAKRAELKLEFFGVERFKNG